MFMKYGTEDEGEYKVKITAEKPGVFKWKMLKSS